MDEKIYYIPEECYGFCYSTYEDIINIHVPELKHMFNRGYGPKNKSQRYTLVKEVLHEVRPVKLAILKEINKPYIIIMRYDVIKNEEDLVNE